MGASQSEFDYDGELNKPPKIVYSVEVKNEDDGKEGLGKVHRHYKFPDRLLETPFEGKTDQERCSTLWWGFQKGLVCSRFRCLFSFSSLARMQVCR